MRAAPDSTEFWSHKPLPLEPHRGRQTKILRRLSDSCGVCAVVRPTDEQHREDERRADISVVVVAPNRNAVGTQSFGLRRVRLQRGHRHFVKARLQRNTQFEFVVRREERIPCVGIVRADVTFAAAALNSGPPSVNWPTRLPSTRNSISFGTFKPRTMPV